MTSSANADLLSSVSESLAPYAMAKNESVATFVQNLLKGTTLENVLEQALKQKN